MLAAMRVKYDTVGEEERHDLPDIRRSGYALNEYSRMGPENPDAELIYTIPPYPISVNQLDL